MITKESQGKIFCKGRGLNCGSCKDKAECVDFVPGSPTERNPSPIPDADKYNGCRVVYRCMMNYHEHCRFYVQHTLDKLPCRFYSLVCDGICENPEAQKQAEVLK